MKPVKYEGFWWLPSNPDNKVFGIIEFSGNSDIFLSIIGTFTHNIIIETSDHEIVLGTTKERKDISLSGCTCISNHQKYRITSAFLGIHYQTIEEMKFYKIVVQYDYLSHWVYSGIPNFINEWNSQQPLKNQNNPKLEAKTTQGKVAIRVFVDTFLDCLGFQQKKRSEIIIDNIKQDLNINEWYLSYLFPLQNLLTLATNRKNLITSISVYSSHRPATIRDKEMPVKLISGIISQDQPEDKKSDDILFILKDIETNFSLCIQKWLNINDEIKHICDIYFGLKYADFMYGELRFLSIVQALESYHRIKIENDCNSSDKTERKLCHKTKVEEIYSTTPKKHLQWLKEKLDFSHEISFQNRIKDLTDKHKKIIDPFVKDLNEFSIKARNTRNYYTHYNQSLKKKAATDDELFRLSQVLNFLLQSCILTELGFSSELCASLITNNAEYQYLIQELNRANFEW